MKKKDPLKSTGSNTGKPNIMSVLKPYQLLIVGLIGFALMSNAVNLLIPKLISNAID